MCTLNVKNFRMVDKCVCIILSILFFLSAIQASKIKLSEVKTNLRCSKWGEFFDPHQSSIVSDIERNMVCSAGSNFYSRVVLELITDSLSNITKFKGEISSSGSNGEVKTTNNPSGCTLSDFERNDPRHRHKECGKLSIPMQVPGTNLILKPGLGLENALDKSIEEMYNSGYFSNGNAPLSYLSMGDVIQSLEIELDVSDTRWVYDLNSEPDHIMPFSYIVKINETIEAYTKATNFTKTGNVQNDGLFSKLSRCVPNMIKESGRIGGKLGGCFRAPCNCSSLPQPNIIPEYYTFELHWVAPNCQMRRIKNSGRPRLSATVDLKLYVVSKLAGVVIDKRVILDKRFWDITSSLPGSSSGGVVGISGKNKMSLVVNYKEGANGINIGGPKAGLSNSLNPGISSSQFQQVLFKSELIRSFKSIAGEIGLEENLNELINISSTQHSLGFNAAPILNGGYIVDCLNDEEILTSEYRNSGWNPYNREDLFPSSINNAPKDKWFYISDGVSRKQHIFSTKLRNSCGLIGVSSASIAIDTKSLDDLCCREDRPILSNLGACIPGSGHVNSSNTPNQIFSELNQGDLFNKYFAPPGWTGFNYYMNGRHTLNLQHVLESLSGNDNILYSLPNAIYNITMEISDVVLETLTGGTKSKVNIPPLSIESPERAVDFYLTDKSVGCVYSSDGSGQGVFIIQKLCNIGNGGSFANVSLEFEGCSNILLFDPKGKSFSKELTGPYQYTTISNLEKGPLAPGGCYEKIFQPFFVPFAKNVKSYSQLYSRTPQNQPQCKKMHISSTKGSTKEITLENIVCEPIYGVFGMSPYRTREDVTLTEDDLYDEKKCKMCDTDDNKCLMKCGKLNKSVYVWLIYVFLAAFLVITLVLIVYFFEKKRELQNNIEVSSRLKKKSKLEKKK